MNASELAANVFAFILHNEIDTKKVSMDEIVKSYFSAQMVAIDEAAKKITA